MKYQIYLNKNASEVVKVLSTFCDMKESTFLKRFLESSIESAFNITSELVGTSNEELNERIKKEVLSKLGGVSDGSNNK